MRKVLLVGGLATAVVAVALTVSFAGGGTVTSATTLTVREHAVNEKVIDLARSGDTAGDLLVFHNPIFNAANTEQVGNDQGECIRTSVGIGAWECHSDDDDPRPRLDHRRGAVLRHPRQQGRDHRRDRRLPDGPGLARAVGCPRRLPLRVHLLP